MTDFDSARARMVERQLRRRGIADERVLAAMGEVPREEFVPERYRGRAYADSALPIGEGQTISQPWIVAAICQALELSGGERVLEVGTGSGYSAAVLARLARRGDRRRAARVAGRRGPPCPRRARRRERRAAASATAAAACPSGRPSRRSPSTPPRPAPPRTLLGQLADGGRLVVPIAADGADLLTVFRRRGEELLSEEIGPCRFVPLIGEEGFGPA